MRFEQLEYLVSVAETKSMTATAERLFVTQQAVSSSLKNLKDELNIELFIKSNHGLEFTQEGLAALKFAETVLDAKVELDKQLEQMEYTEVHVTKVINIVSASKILNSLIPKVSSIIKKNNKKADMKIVLKGSEPQNFSETLREPNFNIGLISINKSEYEKMVKPRISEDYCVEIINEDKLIIVVNAKFYNELDEIKLFSYRDLTTVSNNHLQNYKKVSYGHVGTSYTRMLSDRRQEFTRIDDLEFCKNMLLEEKTIVFTPELSYNLYFKSKKFAKYILEDDNTTILHLAIYKREDAHVIKSFVDALKREIAYLK